MILVIDQHGFTTQILTHQLGAVHIVTATELDTLDLTNYTHVVVSHGSVSANLQALLQAPNLPVLAIGSAYQHLAALYGHTETGSAQPVYGQPVVHRHQASGIFAELADGTELISYHPWRLRCMDAQRFSIQATDDDGAVLAYRVNETQHWGMHADPAALQSGAGQTVIKNFLALAPVDQAAPSPSAHRSQQHETHRLFTRELTGQLDTYATFVALQHDSSAAFWLDSAAADRGQGTMTLMGTNTGELSQTVRWNVTNNQLEVASSNGVQRLTGDIFEYLDTHAWSPTEDVTTDGFTGGWVGYLGYEAKQATVPGHHNRWESATPDAYWIQPQSFVRYNHRTQITTLCAYRDPALLDDLEAALVFGAPDIPEPTNRSELTGRWRLSAAEYRNRVTDIQHHLHTGDAAGICLTDTFSMDAKHLDGLALYRRLRANNPAPYAGYLRFNTFADSLEVLSASPEQFLSIDAAGTVTSKPIKGTVARSHEPQTDVLVAEQMALDAKIQSENLMITDVLRDDLAVVSVPNTVNVPHLMAVESFATVHQLVTTVTGQLLPGTKATTALKAAFPGGSMTGAPKRASLAILDELEAGPRGIYSGTMGWLGHNNAAELNVVIRTIVIDGDQLTIGAGGAVVVDSDPVAEDQEKELKAAALMHSIAEEL